MNKTLAYACLIGTAVFSCKTAFAWEENRTILFSGTSNAQIYTLQPGQSIIQKVNFQQTTNPARRFLRVVGGVKMPEDFKLRGEGNFRKSEFFIDDNLDSICRRRDRYSLYFKGKNEDFERYAFYRIPGTSFQEGELTVTLPIVKKKALTTDKGGSFGLEIGLYYKKEGRSIHDIYDKPDSLIYLPISSGTSKHEQLETTFSIPKNLACVFLQLGGKRFSGECWIEAPRFKQHKETVCSIPFTKFKQRTDTINYWAGCNLSTRSWPRWKLTSKGKTIYEGNVFDRASNVADFYLELPASFSNGEELTLSLMKEPHRAAFPYELHRLELIEETARDFEIIAIPRYVTHHTAFGVLIETNKPNVHLKVTTQSKISPTIQEYFFEKPGLHVVETRAGKAGSSIKMSFEDNNRREEAIVSQVIEKSNEEIYVSSGDEIYIDKEYVPYNYFFKWYLSNRIGNWYHFRPSYQWSGFRVARPEIIKHYTHILNQLNMPYAWQVEGRTLAGNKINPSLKDLASPMFRGKQAHENDGGYYYWQHFKYDGLYSDLAAKARPLGGIFAKHRPIYTEHGTFIHYDPQGVKDMADGARQFVTNLKNSMGESTRHTGPSTLFRYFYQAGYQWLGAEQMYGPEEVILSSLRGASRAYNRQLYGTLHAMQWGSGPFSDPKHALRMYLSLSLAYMHGSSHINTEEALWTDEYLNDRYSKAGKEHLYAQHQVLDFVETHTRRGELTSNIAVIQGRNDGWKSFLRGNIWSQEGKQWKFDKANESFDLLRVFYPENVIDCCGPHGWFSSTPYGTVDLLPIEAPYETMCQYKAMIFLGWNSYDAADIDRIRQFVVHGGTLLLSAAHLNEEVLPNLPTRLPEKDRAIRELLGDNYRQLTKKTIIPLGAGKVIYFPQASYPIEDTIKKDYTSAMKEIAEECILEESKKGWIQNSPSIGFTVWDSLERRTIYLLNNDWKGKEDTHIATFNYKGKEFSIPVRRYHLETIHCKDGLAVMPFGNTTDILSIQQSKDGWNVRFQTTGEDQIRCMNALNGEIVTLQADKAGIFKMKVSAF